MIQWAYTLAGYIYILMEAWMCVLKKEYCYFFRKNVGTWCSGNIEVRYIHTYVHTHIHSYTHTCMQLTYNIHGYVYIYIHAYMHAYIHNDTCMILTYTDIHTYIHTHDTHIYWHTYLHTHQLARTNRGRRGRFRMDRKEIHCRQINRLVRHGRLGMEGCTTCLEGRDSFVYVSANEWVSMYVMECVLSALKVKSSSYVSVNEWVSMYAMECVLTALKVKSSSNVSVNEWVSM